MKLVNRLGNKEAIASHIWELFPSHSVYIEPFFGGGGMFLNKPMAKINHLNDLDSDIFNLWFVLKNHFSELKYYLQSIPYGTNFWQYIKTTEPQNKVEQAVWFVCKSNWGFKGKPDTLSIGNQHTKKMTIKNLIEAQKFFVENETIIIQNTDFRSFFKSIRIREEEINKIFAYCDKPYFLATNQYGKNGKKQSWTLQDDRDLLDILTKLDIKFGISEYLNSPFDSLAKEYGLHLHLIDAKTSLGKDRQEVLWTNYLYQKNLFR